MPRWEGFDYEAWEDDDDYGDEPRDYGDEPRNIEESRLEDTMPAETCRICHTDFMALTRDERTRLRTENRNAGGIHHARGCRFGRCTTHCTCPRGEQVQWRTVERRSFRCRNCATQTTHVCQQVNNVGITNTMTVERGLCARCCQTRECSNNVPCNERVRTTRHCVLCDRTFHVSAFPVDGREPNTTCVQCSLTCRNCGTPFPIVQGEDRLTVDGYVGRCGDCGYCTPEFVSDQREQYNTGFPAMSQRPEEYYMRRCCRCTERRRPRLFQIDSVRFNHAYPDVGDAIKVGKRNPIKRAIGVEIEIAGFKNPSKEALAYVYNTCVNWNAAIGTDGSIGTEAGVEIRTSPASGHLFYKQLLQVTKALEVSGAFATERCGLHVHVDVRDIRDMPFPSERVKRFDALTRAWLLTERYWYNMVAQTRALGTFCRPIAQNFYDVKNVTYFDVMRNRYQGLNMSAIDRHQTVEFRLHQGTVNFRTILAWALLCASFVDKIVTSEYPEGLAELAEANPMGFLKTIAPTRDARKYLTLRERRAMRAERKAA